MHGNYTFRQQLEAFQKDKTFLDGDRCFYFYDWFCQVKSLKRKANGLMAKAKFFAEVMKIDIDTHYVWFKNNCPLYGRLYDDFRFATCEDGAILYTVIPSSGFKSIKGQSEVWCPENRFENAFITKPSWSDMKIHLKERNK